MKITTGYRWHLRRAGGINIGIRIHFPAYIQTATGANKTWLINIGLIALTIDIEIETETKTIRQYQ